MKNYTSQFNQESNEDRDKRILSMLKSMILETYLYCLKHRLRLPAFSCQQISDYCGCSRHHIWRLEVKALKRLKERLS